MIGVNNIDVHDRVECEIKHTDSLHSPAFFVSVLCTFLV